MLSDDNLLEQEGFVFPQKVQRLNIKTELLKQVPARKAFEALENATSPEDLKEKISDLEKKLAVYCEAVEEELFGETTN